ncbi:MAG TPA: SapC family protein [Phenylobacterium sp.]|nr:SapC family protein [Phenylobacterium sp.]
MSDIKTTPVQNPGPITGNVLFYKQPEPLNPEMHGKLGVKQMESPFGFAREGHAVPLTVGEFPLAAICGPIIFVGDDKTPLAVMGLNPGRNMFIDEAGMFEAGFYIPAYIRRYPFVYAQDDNAKQMVLCIDRGADFIVEGGDMPFFDEKGQPSDYTKRCMEFCNNFEVERNRTLSFVQILKDLDLFEVKIANFIPANPDGTAGEPQKIADYFGVSEEKLNKLPAAKLAELRDNGALQQIYTHLASLVGWDRLIALTMVRQQQDQPHAANA